MRRIANQLAGIASASLMLPIAAWAGALQTVAPAPSSLEQVIRLLGAASLLGSLTVLVYRLGIWRQQMEQTKHAVVTDLAQCRSESASAFARLERRLGAMDRRLARLEHKPPISSSKKERVI